MLAFLSKGLGMDEEKLADWLDDEVGTRTTVFATPCPERAAAFYGREQIDVSDKDSSNFSTFFGECVP